MAGYPIPAGRQRVEDVVRRSRFIATVGHAPDRAAAEAFIAAIRREFSDASHNCWAFVAGAPGSTAQIGMSDDGEPGGTAGRPILNVLLHSGVGELVTVVTRYFGGTKLGTGGLVRAYRQATQHALTGLPLSQRINRRRLILTLGYADLEGAERLLAECSGVVLASNYGASVELTAALPDAELSRFRRQLATTTSGRAGLRLPGAPVNSGSDADPADT